MPYLAEENADEDPEVTFATATDDSAHQRAKATLLGVGREVCAGNQIFELKRHTAGAE